MKLEEAILHCEEVSQNCNNAECALEHAQLACWLKELKMFREGRARLDENGIIVFNVGCEEDADFLPGIGTCVFSKTNIY